MFRTLIHPSFGACDFSAVSPHWLCVLVSMCIGVSVWLVGVVSVWQASACHTDSMFRAHVLIIRRSKLRYRASDIITPVGVMISEAV